MANIRSFHSYNFFGNQPTPIKNRELIKKGEYVLILISEYYQNNRPTPPGFKLVYTSPYFYNSVHVSSKLVVRLYEKE